jgi:hypothetical protein
MQEVIVPTKQFRAVIPRFGRVRESFPASEDRRPAR